MDQREKQVHSHGICNNRLLNSFRKRFAELSLKVTIFGCLFTCGLAVCRGLFDSIVQNLQSQAMKPVILGPRAQNRPSQGPSSGPCVESEQASGLRTVSASLPSLSSNSNDFLKNGKELQPIQDGTEVVVPESEIATQVKRGTPKKMVSINDQVVTYYNNEKKKEKATDKSSYLECGKDEEPKPLKSILKVGSNLKYRSRKWAGRAMMDEK